MLLSYVEELSHLGFIFSTATVCFYELLKPHNIYDTFMSLSKHYIMINMKFTTFCTHSKPEKFIGQLKFRILKMTLIAL